MKRFNETEILLEITLHVGNSIDLNEMLGESVSVMMRLLNCSGAQVLRAVVEKNNGTLDWKPVLTMPRPLALSEGHTAFLESASMPTSSNVWTEWSKKLPLFKQNGTKSRLMFNLPDFGVLVMEMNTEPFDTSFIRSFQPILNKLANASLACQAAIERKEAEKALLYSEEINRSLLGTIPDVVIRTDLNGMITFVNESGLKGLPIITSNKLLGKNILSFISKKDRRRAIHNTKLMFEKPIGIKEYSIILDNMPIDCEINGDIVHDAENIPIGMVYVIRDITERKSIQAKIKESELHFKTLFYEAADAIFIADIESGIIIDANEAACRLTQMSHEKIIGMHQSGLHPKNEKENATASFNIHVEASNFFLSPKPIENLVVRADCSTVPIEIMASQILYKGKKCLMGTFRDISERKQNELQLRKLSQAVEQSPAQIIITGLDGKIEYVNPKFTEVTGYTFDEVKSKNPSILKSGEHSPEVYKDLWDTIISGKEWRGEFHNKKKNGEMYWEADSISPIMNREGKITHYLAVKEDITQRKMAEQELIAAKVRAEESDLLKTAFLQNMSHEIRTPMNAICGFSGLLTNDYFSKEELKSFINIIQNSSQQLLSIITDILTISSIDTGQEKINKSIVNINKLISETEAIFKQHVIGKKVILNGIKSLPDDESEIQTDGTKLNQILTNLISNAIKYTSKGEITFGYMVRNDELEFFVKDTGIGISKNKLKIIFDRFVQADDTIRIKYGGTGLGLSISKGLVELLGGNIWVESEPQKGSVFTFTIPFEPAFKSKKGEFELELMNTLKDLHILIVEDDMYSSLLLKEYLKEYNCHTLHIKNGEEAVKICKENSSIDIVLMDIRLPIMNGTTAAKLIKSFRPNLPIVCQSAYDQENEIDKIFDAYIKKPISQENLMFMLNRYSYKYK